MYSYTLEANFNTGRVVNSVPSASRDAGRATPPPTYDLPPKYDPSVYEDSGKAMAISILDLTESNPWTRLTCSSCKNLKGVKDGIRKHIKQTEEQAKKDGKGKDKAAGSTGSSTNTSPRRSARRTRTLSSSAVSSVAKRNKCAGQNQTPKTGNSPLKAPSSPDSYRPVSKIPRKNLVGKAGQSQSGMLASLVSPGSAGTTKTKTKKVTKMFKRSKSIPNASLLPLISELDLPSNKKTRPGLLTRSQSISLPGSRASSPPPKRLQGVKKKRIGVKAKAKNLESFPSTSSGHALTSGPCQKKKTGKKAKKAGNTSLPGSQ